MNGVKKQRRFFSFKGRDYEYLYSSLRNVVASNATGDKVIFDISFSNSFKFQENKEN